MASPVAHFFSGKSDRCSTGAEDAVVQPRFFSGFGKEPFYTTDHNIYRMTPRNIPHGYGIPLTIDKMGMQD